jgi:nucleoid DNA-binding protein
MAGKADLVAHVASATGMTKVKAASAVAAVLDGIAGSLAKGDSVSLVGFGSFRVTETKARTGRNPATGAPLRIAAGKRIGFRAGTRLRSRVSGSKTGAKGKAGAKKAAKPAARGKK